MVRWNGVAVRETPARVRADEWALVLAAAGIEATVDPTSGTWRLTVDAANLQRAQEALDAYDLEQQTRAREQTPLPDWGPTRAGIVAALLLVGFHAAIQADADAYRLGRAVGERILDGEWWRAVTALTLHANVAHVAGNAVAGAIFLTAVCRLVGPGVGVCMALLSGAGANMINAAIRPPGHAFLGASTAVFACLGILSGYQLLRQRRAGRPRGRQWLPLAAGLALLGWLGAGPNSDVVGHLLGFFVGGVVGISLGLRVCTSLPVSTQYGLIVTTFSIVCGCWLLAFLGGSP